jgi:CRP/FNR family transcriptional regulator
LEQQQRSVGDVLRRIPFFAELGEASLAALARQVRTRRYSAGKTVVADGWPCEGLSFIVRGHVRVYRSTSDGREQVLRVVGPGRTFNEAAAFDEGLNAEGAVAVDEVVTGLVPSLVLRAEIDRHPEIAKAATRLLANRQRALGQMVEDLGTRDVTARVAKVLLGCAGRYDHVVDGAPGACSRITHQEIASMVGSVREVVQRSLKELERKGAIKLERAHIKIVSIGTLERFSEGSGD